MDKQERACRLVGKRWTDIRHTTDTRTSESLAAWNQRPREKKEINVYLYKAVERHKYVADRKFLKREVSAL
jgi:hypothetical protein